MINNFRNIISLFFPSEFSLVSVTEEYDCIEIKVEGINIQFPEEEIFNRNIEFINNRDNIHLSFLHKNQVIENFSSRTNTSFNNFIETLKQNTTGKTRFELILTIEKKNREGKVSIYFIDQFINGLDALTFIDLLVVFRELFANRNFIFFEILDQESKIELITSSIIFTTNNSNTVLSNNELGKRKEKIKNICHCNIIDEYNYSPDDFYPVKLSSSQNLNNLFKKISITYSLIYLFDIVNIFGNEIDFKLNGYKTIIKKLPISLLSLKASEAYYNIYEWVYSGGGIIDKIGLARNIISLNIDINNLFIDESVFDSIQSGYKIYQKENIKQYIEVRNKISDQLIEIQKNADKIVDEFIGDFKKSLFTFVSFFASVLVLKVVSNGNLEGGFSIEITLLSIGFLIIGFIVMLFRRFEINRQVERYKLFYQNMKKRYCDLLDKNDISRILNNDVDFNTNVNYINTRVKEYSRVWILSIIVLLIIVLAL